MSTNKKYITIRVDDQTVGIYVPEQKLIAGSKNFIGIKIEPMDDLWESMQTVIVTIVEDGAASGNKKSIVAIDNVIEPERLDFALKRGTYYVSLVGYVDNMKVTTNSAYFTVERSGEDPTSVTPFNKITRKDNFLYKIDYKGMPSHYEYAKDYINEKHDELFGGGACSIYYDPTNNVFAKNFDWTYSKCVDFFVTTNDYVGMAGGIPELTYDINYDTPSTVLMDLGKVIPWLLNSGYNKHGVAVGMNIVPFDDTKGGVPFTAKTTGTNPGATRICALMLPSIILDQCENLDDLDELLDSYDIYCDSKHEREYHIMVTKNGVSKVIEFIDNTVEIIDITDRPYLTNFYIYGSGEVETINDVTDHATGWTRYKMMEECFNYNDDVNALDLMRTLQFTRAYKDINSRRDEFAGIYPEYGDITLDVAMNDPEAMEDLLTAAQNAYLNRDRTDGKTWHTDHTVVYHMNLELVDIEVQENGVVYTEICF